MRKAKRVLCVYLAGLLILGVFVIQKAAHSECEDIRGAFAPKLEKIIDEEMRAYAEWEFEDYRARDLQRRCR